MHFDRGQRVRALDIKAECSLYLEDSDLTTLLFLALTKQLTEKYGLPVKSAFSASRGFYLQLYISGNTVTSDSETPTGQHPSSKLNVEDLPREFLKVTKHRHTFSFYYSGPHKTEQ